MIFKDHRSHISCSWYVACHAGILSWWNWNLEMLFFLEVGKPENPEKDPQENQLIPPMTPGRNRTAGPNWWEASALITRSTLLQNKCSSVQIPVCSHIPRVFPIMFYTVRLRPKGVLFPGSRYCVRVENSEVDVHERVGNSQIEV